VQNATHNGNVEWEYCSWGGGWYESKHNDGLLFGDFAGDAWHNWPDRIYLVVDGVSGSYYYYGDRKTYQGSALNGTWTLDNNSLNQYGHCRQYNTDLTYKFWRYNGTSIPYWNPCIAIKCYQGKTQVKGTLSQDFIYNGGFQPWVKTYDSLQDGYQISGELIKAPGDSVSSFGQYWPCSGCWNFTSATMSIHT